MVSAKIETHTTETIEKIRAIQGTLVMANFRGKDKYKCGIILEDGTYLSNISFDADLADTVAAALRKKVYTIGIAVLEQDGRIKSYSIQKLVIITPDVTLDQLETMLNEHIEENDTAAHFRQGIKEVLSGKARPISELWDNIDVE